MPAPQLQHSGRVKYCACSLRGKVSLSNGGSQNCMGRADVWVLAQVFDVAGEQVAPLADLSGHEGPVWQVLNHLVLPTTQPCLFGTQSVSPLCRALSPVPAFCHTQSVGSPCRALRHVPAFYKAQSVSPRSPLCSTVTASLWDNSLPPRQVAWAHPKFGSLLASCSFDHRVIVWKEAPENTWTPVRPSACPAPPAAREPVHSECRLVCCLGSYELSLMRIKCVRVYRWNVSLQLVTGSAGRCTRRPCTARRSTAWRLRRTSWGCCWRPRPRTVRCRCSRISLRAAGPPTRRAHDAKPESVGHCKECQGYNASCCRVRCQCCGFWPRHQALTNPTLIVSGPHHLYMV